MNRIDFNITIESLIYTHETPTWMQNDVLKHKNPLVFENLSDVSKIFSFFASEF